MSVRELAVLGDHQGDVDAIVGKYPNARSALIPLLFYVQSVQGHVTEEGMRDVAQVLGLTPAEVLSVASFYTMLKKRSTGEYLISVCRNITCTHLGGRKVLRAAEERLGVSAGQSTPDGRFTLEAAECLATCDGAPSLQVNYEDFYKVSPEEMVEIIDRLERGDEVLSVAGEAIQTHKGISREVAMTGVVEGHGDQEQGARTVSGEVPPADMAPGFRPPVKGHGAKEDSDA
jgi:NADH-quinone oxidoreductase E subunit